MSKHTYRIFWIVLAALFIGFVWADISKVDATDVISNEARTENKVKDGTIDTHDKWGNLKTRVNYKNGYKHGISYLFYDNGQVQLAMPYQFGKREGVSRKYYENGEIYAETPYRNDLLTGKRVLFYRNGKQKAELPYLNSWPGTGLKEYNLEGQRRELSSLIDYKISGNELRIFAPADCSRKVEFMITDLVDGKYLNIKDPEMIRIAQSNHEGIINLNVYTPSYLRFRDIVCTCRTRQGNEWITKMSIDLTR